MKNYLATIVGLWRSFWSIVRAIWNMVSPYVLIFLATWLVMFLVITVAGGIAAMLGWAFSWPMVASVSAFLALFISIPFTLMVKTYND